MIIKKDNIVIRKANIDDTHQLNTWWNDGKVMEHAGFPRGLGQSLEKTRESIESWESKAGELCIIEIDGKMVGELSYKIDEDGLAYTGWKICEEDYQNQGYGTKIIKLTFELLFTDEEINTNTPVKKIVWDTMLDNKRAQHVYEEKIKGRKTAVKEKAFKDQTGSWRGVVYYELDREDFLNK